MSEVKALVTGGGGFIGSHVVDELISLDFNVSVIDNFQFGKHEYIKHLGSSNVIEGDLRNTEFVNDALKLIKPTAVFHLAAIHFIPYCNDHPIEAVESNIMGTRNLLRGLESLSVSNFFFASTAAVYPPKDSPHLESDTPAPMDIYGITKLLGEDLVNAYVNKTNTRGIIGRLFNAIGPRETNPHLLPEILKQLKEGKRTLKLGNLAPKRDFIHVRDMAKAITQATLKSTGFDTINIGSSSQYSVKEVVDTFSKVLGEKITVEQDPSRVRKVERPFLVAETEKLLKLIKWQPEMSLEATIKELLH